MSVQTEINRIKANVTAALNAIKAKGVTIPSGANSDNLATLIAAIQTAPATVSCTVNGAPGEKVSYSGATLGSVTLNSSGTATVSGLTKGTHTFVGSVSGYSKSVNVTTNQVVDVWPGKPIYWYGRWFDGNSATNTGGTITPYTNYFNMGFPNNAYRLVRTANMVSLSGYNTLKATVTYPNYTSSSQGYQWFGYQDSFPSSITVSNRTSWFDGYTEWAKTNAKQTMSVNISAETASKYIGVVGYAQELQIHAIWME